MSQEAKSISAATRFYGVVGRPIGHSLSPLLHNYWMRDHDIDAAYVALPIRDVPDHLVIDRLRAAGDLGFGGLNITAPFKEAALAAADKADSAAQAIGAANVLDFRNQTVFAANTDADGFIAALDEGAPNWRKTTPCAVLLGAGGAAMAVAYALAQAGVDRILIVNRSFDRAHRLAATTPRAEAIFWDHRTAAIVQADLLINALSGPDAVAAALVDGLPPGDGQKIAMDLTYRPLETAFLAAARAQNWVCVDGLGMLVHQAAAAFEIWFGLRPDAKAGRRRALAHLATAA